jgi:predicted glycogen debranching enzyme
LIALPGLFLATGRFEEAKKILRACAKALHKGLLPDRLPAEKGKEPMITSPDASLWLGVAAWKYLATTGDEAFVRETLLPALRKVVFACEQGTFQGIRVEEDGLLAVGEGKSVEVNALWFNALAIQAEIEARLGDAAEAKTLAQRARQVQKRFQEVFWNEEAGYLYDVVNGDERDAALRPNQLLALSLPFPLLPKLRAARVLAAVEEKLYTPVGLRTLEPGHPDYDVASYHQGAVWAWLLGPYYSAQVRVHGAAGRKKALAALAELRPRLVEAGVASLPEVFDPEPSRSPRGSIARAWGVAEVLRAYVEDLQPGEVKAKKEAAVVAPEPAAKSKAAKPARGRGRTK